MRTLKKRGSKRVARDPSATYKKYKKEFDETPIYISWKRVARNPPSRNCRRQSAREGGFGGVVLL